MSRRGGFCHLAVVLPCRSPRPPLPRPELPVAAALSEGRLPGPAASSLTRVPNVGRMHRSVSPHPCARCWAKSKFILQNSSCSVSQSPGGGAQREQLGCRPHRTRAVPAMPSPHPMLRGPSLLGVSCPDRPVFPLARGPPKAGESEHYSPRGTLGLPSTKLEALKGQGEESGEAIHSVTRLVFKEKPS